MKLQEGTRLIQDAVVMRNQLKLWCLVVPAFLLLFVGQALAAEVRCGICGEVIETDAYFITDRVTGEKVEVCDKCAKLPHRCFLCGLPVRTNSLSLPDDRYCCARDAKEAVVEQGTAERMFIDVEEELDRLFARFLTFPSDTNVTFAMIDRVDIQDLFKYAGNDYTCPDVWGYMESKTNGSQMKHDINLLSALPPEYFKATCAHEYAHAWMHENVSPARLKKLSRDSIEGFCELIAYMLMDSENSETGKKHVLQNTYTRGQVQLFIDAKEQFGFNDVVDWIQYGTDVRLDAHEPTRIRDVVMPKAGAGKR